ncbi:Ger(x)C family spore germination protein [Salsuginibacillus kocurii]|uniref:Ger(x)C family spore germination protein n=1 Tax=Salsuginibacillus kocurii TaxID=427078 RepID=UPI00037A2B4E|nr:Ger(x)C family spore germination protein [Salsuginibacillus kocurii]
MKNCLLMLGLLLVVSGCVETKVIEESSLIQASAFDKAEDGKIKHTITYPSFIDQGEESHLRVKMLSAVAETTQKTSSDMENKSQRTLRIGQLRVVLIGRELAEDGIKTILDTYYRDPMVGNRIYIAVTDEDAEESVKIATLERGERAGMYFSDLIKHNVENENMPETNLHLFVFAMFSEGKDPHLPYIGQTGERAEIEGTALFKGAESKMVGKLDMDESFLLQKLKIGPAEGTKQFHVDWGDIDSHVFLEDIHSETRISMDQEAPEPTFTIKITMRGIINDFDERLDLGVEGKMEKMEKSMSKQLEEEMKQLLVKLQELEVDPAGFGQQYRQAHKGWDREEFYDEIYPNLQFNFDVEVNVVQSGAVE